MPAEKTLPTVYEALNYVMGAVQAVGKNDRNQQQGYIFRGVDSVVNAVGPALREHGVIVVPVAEDMKSETYTSKGGALMRNVTVKIRWVFYGPAGDSVEAVTYGEAADAGDKAVPKAHSVAYRVALLQALCIPTHDPDPDAHAHERVAPPAGQRRPPAFVEGTSRHAPEEEPADVQAYRQELRERALALRDEALAAKSKDELLGVWKKAGAQTLATPVPNESGDDEDLGALIKRRGDELPAAATEGEVPDE